MNNQNKSASPHWPEPSYSSSEWGLGPARKSKSQSVEDFCSCAVLSHVLLIWSSSLQGNCSAPCLRLSHEPGHSLSGWLLPGGCCLEGANDGSLISNSRTPPSPGAAAASSQTQLPVKDRDSSTAEADKSSFVLTTHSKPERQGECPRVSGKGLQHPCPAFWLPLRTCWQSHPPTVCFSLALAVTPPVTTLWSPSTFPLHSWHNPTLWGHIPSISAAHFSAPSPARQQGFFKAYILEIATVSNY